jgi:hypothetical protein
MVQMVEMTHCDAVCANSGPPQNHPSTGLRSLSPPDQRLTTRSSLGSLCCASFGRSGHWTTSDGAFTPSHVVPMEDKLFLTFAALFLVVLQFAIHWFLKWRLRIAPANQQKLDADCSPVFLRYRRRLATASKVQSHIGMVFGPWLCMFLAVMSTDSPDHPEYAPALVGSVTAIISYLLFLELPLQATRQWALHRTTFGAWTSVANIALNIWCTPFWVVFPFQAYFLARTLHSSRKQHLVNSTEAADEPKTPEALE